MIKNKKAQMPKPTVKTMVVISFVMVSLIVLIFLVFQGGEVLWGITHRDTCGWEFLTHGIANIASASFFITNPECRMLNNTITLADLEKEKSNAKKMIRQYKKIYKKEIPFDEDNEDDLLEFAIYNIIGEEMRNAWDDVWKGNLPFLNQWWLFQPCGDLEQCETKTAALNRVLGFHYDELESYGAAGAEILLTRAFGRPVKGLIAVELLRSTHELIKEKNIQTNPCIARSRITFDNSIKTKFGDKIFTRFVDWMEMNKVPKDIKKRNYLDYFGENVVKGKELANYIRYFDVNTEYVILYQRDNTNLISNAIISPLRVVLGDAVVDAIITKDFVTTDIDEELLIEENHLYLTKFEYENFRYNVKCHIIIA